MPTPDELRGALRRALETHQLLGARHLPITPAAKRKPATAVRAPSAGCPAGPGAARTASAASPSRPAAAAPKPAHAPLPRPPGFTPDLPGDRAERQRLLDELNKSQVVGCRKCVLCEHRTQTVFGQGNALARLAFVGEAPGADEDASGLAFVGMAGQLLTKMITAMGLSRDEVYICNVLKCRPPDNKFPTDPGPVNACRPYLEEQLRIIQPELIVTLGRPASQTLLDTTVAIGRLRGEWSRYTPPGGRPIPVMPTYHPSYLLRCPWEKPKVWSDLKQVMSRLGLPVPE